MTFDEFQDDSFSDETRCGELKLACTTVLFALGDNPRRLEEFRRVMALERDFEILEGTAEGAQLVRLCRRLRPHVLVLDPAGAGLDDLRVLRRRVASMRIIVLARRATPAGVRTLLKGGARGVVPCETEYEEIVGAIRVVDAGRPYISPGAGLDEYAALTMREREVLQLTAVGLGQREIAERLSLSKRTIETHRANFRRKLALHSRQQLLRFAADRGLIP